MHDWVKLCVYQCMKSAVITLTRFGKHAFLGIRQISLFCQNKPAYLKTSALIVSAPDQWFHCNGVVHSHCSGSIMIRLDSLMNYKGSLRFCYRMVHRSLNVYFHRPLSSCSSPPGLYFSHYSNHRKISKVYK